MKLEELEDFFHNRATAEQSARVEEWLIRNAETDDDDADRLLRQLFERLEVVSGGADVDKAFHRFKQRIYPGGTHTVGRLARLRPALNRLAQWAAVAAVVLTLGAVCLYYRHQSNKPKEWIEQYTVLGETKKVILPDGSTVWLNVGSKVIYPKKFNDRIRQVYVSGEVFAEVLSGDARPFVLSVGEASVKVVGTKFNVRSYLEDSHIEVTLVEGAIDFEFVHDNITTVRSLSPGEVVSLDRATGQISRYDIEPSEYRRWGGQGGLYFRNLTLKDIVRYLERYFMVEIVVADPELLDYRFYASFINDESVDQILTTINGSSTMDITERNGIIYIAKAE